MNLMQHQRQAVEIAREHSHYCFFWQPGTGKTIAILAILNDEQPRISVDEPHHVHRPLRTLVLAPKSVMRAAWMSDAKYFPNLKVEVCWQADRMRRVSQIRGCKADVLVTNYETLKKHADDFLAAGVRRLIVDESSKIKAHDTQTTRSVLVFAQKMDSVYLLSGTPAPNNETEYYSQLRAVGCAGIVDNYWRFCYYYFTPIKRNIGYNRTIIVRWVPKPDRREEFISRLKSVSWSLSKEEAVDLPEQTDVIREVTLTPRERGAYVKAHEQLRVATETITKEAALIKCRQLAGGFAYVEEGDVTYGTSKLQELKELLEELGNEPVVIWCDFRFEIDRIRKVLGYSCAVLDGRTTNASDIIAAFQSGETRYLICQPQTAGHGITLTRACYAIYYSMNFSYELYQQSRDRIHRKGQTRACTYFHLVALDTVDEALVTAIQGKKSKAEIISLLLRRKKAKHEPAFSGSVAT